MKRFTLDFTVGIFVIIGIVCAIFLSLKVANDNINTSSKQSYTLYARFSNIGSLKTDAPVKVSGFVVGRVAAINLDPQTYQAVATLVINDKYKFTTDSSAQILTTGLLGEQYISLQSGADTTYLQDKSTIGITSSALVLEDLIGKFMTNLNK